MEKIVNLNKEPIQERQDVVLELQGVVALAVKAIKLDQTILPEKKALASQRKRRKRFVLPS